MSIAYYHYTDANNQPVGPLAAEQLHALVRSGTIPPDTAVWKEGAPEWHPYHSMFPPLVVRRPASASPTPGAPQSRSLRPWYKRTGWSIVLFYFCAPVMLPPMWYWKLYTLRTRIVVTSCFAGLFLWAFVCVRQDENVLRREFAASRVQVLARVKNADAAGDYETVIHLRQRYEIIPRSATRQLP